MDWKRMSNFRALMWMVVLWLGVQVAEFSLSQWLTQNSDGLLAAIKPILSYLLVHAAGEFGVGFLAGVATLSVFNWPVTSKFIKKCTAVFLGGAGEKNLDDIQPTTVNYFGALGGAAPGAGGGGGSALGPHANAGAGGAGGARTSFILTSDVLEKIKSGDLKVQFAVGEGGESDPTAIRKGADGEDTWIKFFDANDEEIFKVIASGGVGGESGKIDAYSGSYVSEQDFSVGLRSSTLMLAEAAYQKHGLVYLMGGGIDSYVADGFPVNVKLVMLNVFTIPALGDSVPRKINFSVISPVGEVIDIGSVLILPDCVNTIKSHSDIRVLDFVAHSSGVWVVLVSSGSLELSRLPLSIRPPEPP